MRKGLTVTDLARRVLPEADDDELASVVRQLRYWTVARVIPTVREGEILKGSGRHRSYDAATVPLVAVAVELGRWRVAMETIRLVLAGLHARTEEEPRRGPEPVRDDPHGWGPVVAKTMDPARAAEPPARNRDRELWKAALDGQDGVFLVLQIPLTLEAAGGIDVIVETDDGLARHLARPHQLSTVVISLSRLFARLR